MSNEPQSEKSDLGTQPTYFQSYMKKRYGTEDAEQIMGALTKLGLPLPEKEGEFIQGREEVMIPLNRYGSILRIGTTRGAHNSDRTDSAWDLPSIGKLFLNENHIIDLVPGGRLEQDPRRLDHVREKMKEQGIELWDNKLSNVVRVPVNTARFPDGITLVSDRLAARENLLAAIAPRRVLGRIKSNFLSRLTGEPEPQTEEQEIKKAVEQHYAPMQREFMAGWNNNDMKSFWSTLATATQQGKLVAGWNDPKGADAQGQYAHSDSADDKRKTLAVAETAARYEERLAAVENKPSRPTVVAPVKPPSLS